MSLDRVIEFPILVPSAESVDNVLRNFLGEAGKVEKKSTADRVDPTISLWEITLQGPFSYSLASEKGSVHWALDKESKDKCPTRWIEVYLHPATKEDPVTIDILTRQMDDYTNAVADGLVKVFNRYWDGTREEQSV